MNAFKALFNRGEIASRSTAPIYRLDEGGRRELFATGLFFRHSGRHFVLSAAHALVELRDKELSVGGETSIVPLTGPFFHMGQVGQVNFDADSFDAAFVPLNEDQLSQLHGTVFLSEDNIEPTESLSNKPLYYAVGFIANDFRAAAAHEPAEAKATLIVAAPSPSSTYQERGVGQETHVLLSFDRLRTHSPDGQAATPKINGMSGSGIWRHRLFPGFDKIVAMLTEHHQKEDKFIVATRLSSIVPALAAFASGSLPISRRAV